ncbi:MAG: hypothetical protein R2831_12505 [Chitinophagaceae bacterium]
MQEFKQSTHPTTVVSEILSMISDTTDEEQTKKEIDETNNPVLAAKNGFMLLLQLFKNNETLHPLKEFMSRKRTERDGNMVDGILTVHSRKRNTSKSLLSNSFYAKSFTNILW